jgi:cellulose synthase (UDP-forming)
VRSKFWNGHPRLVQAVALAALGWGAAYLAWRIGWSGAGVGRPLFFVLLLAEIFGWVSLGFYAFLAWRVPETSRPPLPDDPPVVDVFVCTYDEPVRVLEATLVGCREMRGPHVTWVLDDGRRAEVQALATRLGARYLTRPDNRHAKAGNINAALPRTHGDLILFLDADHVPMPDILEATLGYFDDPDVALVQTPHDFFNRDSVQHTRTARHEQTLFYDVIACGKDRHDASGAARRR